MQGKNWFTHIVFYCSADVAVKQRHCVASDTMSLAIAAKDAYAGAAMTAKDAEIARLAAFRLAGAAMEA